MIEETIADFPALHAGSDGPPVMLLHGFGSDRTSWRLNQMALAETAQTAAPDLPGHGASTLPVGDGSIATLSRAVEPFLVRIGPAHLVGHSLGGAIAVDLAARRPDLVLSLFLVAPAGLGKGIDPHFLTAFPEMQTVADADAIMKTLVARPRLIGPQVGPFVLGEVSRPGAREALRLIAAQLGHAHKAIADAVVRVSRTSLPRLVLWGAADLSNPRDETYLATFRSEFVLLKEAAHLPHMENPGTVNPLMRDFLARAASRS